MSDIKEINPLIYVIFVALIAIIWILNLKQDGMVAKWLRKHKQLEEKWNYGYNCFYHRLFFA